MTELRQAFPGLEPEFDAVVAENGAVLAHRGRMRDLAAPVDPALSPALARRGVRVRRGRVLLAGSTADDATVLEEVARLGLDCQLVRNRSELMVLPAGVTKGTGLARAFGELNLSPHSAIGVGDAENDHALLEVCELGVTVANAVEELAAGADLVLDEPDGAGVAALLRGPLVAGEQRLPPRRWQIELGHTSAGEPVRLPASQTNMVITGGSFSGKSHAAGLVVEQLVGLGYSVVVLDAEGDHTDLAGLPDVAVVGGADPLPGAEQLGRLVTHHAGGLVLDLSLLSSHEHEPYLRAVAEQLVRRRADTGVPHWVVVEEAHILLAHEGAAYGLLAGNAMGLCAVTYRPHDLSGALRDAADAVVAAAGTGLGAEGAAIYLAGLIGQPAEGLLEWLAGAASEEALLVRAGRPETTAFRVAARRTGHVRHQRKYAAYLGFFLRISDLEEFRAVLGCCSESTVDFHARRHDFSRWIGGVLGDGALAASVAEVEDQRRAESATTEATRTFLLGAVPPPGDTRHRGAYGDEPMPDHLGFFLHISDLEEFRAVLGCCSESTVDFHARRHDFSRWIGGVLGDGALAASVGQVEAELWAESATPEDTRASLLGAIDARCGGASADG